MDIQFKKVNPHPLNAIQHSSESIWNSDFVLKSGTKVLLNASSGKGKSTFSGILFGLRSDYEGSILFGDKELKSFTKHDWTTCRVSKISIVFQDLQLFPELTVKENLELKNNLTNSFSLDEIQRFNQQLGIGDKWEQKCQFLSMGQQQRVAIVRALLQPFDWLILDEPFSHLDEENTTICLDLINQRCDALGAGFILTSLGSKHQFSYDHELKL